MVATKKDILKHKKSGQSISIRMILTEDCNLRCTYCYAGNNKNPKKMTKKIGENIIDYWLENSEPPENDKQELSLWGGEPLLEWELFKHLVKYAQSKNDNLKIWTVTNGVLFTPEKIKWCHEHKVFVCISVDGVKGIHDKYRKFKNGSGSWEIIEKNIKATKKFGKYQFLMTTVTPYNTPYLLQSLKYYFEELGINYINYVFQYEGNWTKDDFIELETQARHMIDYAKDNGITLPPWTQQLRKYNPGCGAGTVFSVWSVEGIQFPCHRFDLHDNTFKEKTQLPYAFGYLKDDKFIKLNNKNDFVYFNENQNSKCLKCEIFGTKFCEGGCFGVNFIYDGNIHGTYSNQCEFKKLLYRVSKDLWKLY